MKRVVEVLSLARENVPEVEACRLRFDTLAKMPLSDHGRRVPRRTQVFCDVGEVLVDRADQRVHAVNVIVCSSEDGSAT